MDIGRQEKSGHVEGKTLFRKLTSLCSIVQLDKEFQTENYSGKEYSIVTKKTNSLFLVFQQEKIFPTTETNI